jgi:squalene-hopene/tetraprenyl-beta-curcumene cyclase
MVSSRIAATSLPAACLYALLALACATPPDPARESAPPPIDSGQEPAAGAAFSPAQQKAFAFLMTQQKDGVFSASFGGKTFPDPAFTGFGLLALQTKAKATRTAAENEAIDKGMKWLLAGQNADGSFGRQLQNYTTSVVVGALARWGDPAAKPALEKAQKYILKCQNVESSGFQSSDRDYGSIGYGDSQRGDLSNVNFALQALRESGLPANDEAFQKALVFLQRSQNLKAVNDFSGKVSNPDDGGKLIDVTSGDDGGGMYYPGNSAAGYEVTPDGKSVPRSYGSMTYALLKSYTLCGVKSDDPRVQKAVDWIATNWTLEVNPGFVAPTGDKAHYAGLFYYYMVLAQSLDMAGVTTVTRQVADGKSKPIDWKKDLRARLEGMQQAGGGWLNDKNPRWMEGVDVLCTCYALLALERCR